MADAVMMPKEPTAAMREACLKRLTNPTVKDPKAAAWDALIAYRAMWEAVAQEEPGDAS